MATASRGRNREPWRNNERHYCEYCNAWMGSDRQSILLHENGKKHKANVEKALKKKRDDRASQEKASRDLQKSLQAIQQAAVEAHFQDIERYGDSAIESHAAAATMCIPTQSQQQQLVLPTPSNKNANKASAKKEKSDWESRKKKREAQANRRDTDREEPAKKIRRKLGPNEGHYQIDGQIYLEGSAFFNLLEEDLTIELWTGSDLASSAEKRLPEKHHLWRSALIIRVRNLACGEEMKKAADVSYLKEASDEEETVEKSVPLNRIRMMLEGDEKLPDTLEEARLAAMGEEVIRVQEEAVEVDENTGLSSWGTVEIRKTTVRNELKEERERLRAKRKEEAERLEQEKKKAEIRKMEEAKVGNAEDSALGAYDVMSAGKSGYKGVDISQETVLSVEAIAKSLSKGKGSVGFKKKKGKKNRNRRTTSADD